jgi:hypothetical protein
MSTPIDFDERDRAEERDVEPPAKEDGQFICARPCKDGSRCMAHVPFGYMTCYQHDRSQAIVPKDGDRDD